MRIEARKEKLVEVLAFVDAELEKAEVSVRAQTQLDIAVEEIFINIASYAYPDSEGFADILLAIDPSARTVEITFIDSGIPYNPLAKEDPDVTLAAKDRQIGGLGIFMVKKSMDDVRYEYKDGQNILTIVKKY